MSLSSADTVLIDTEEPEAVSWAAIIAGAIGAFALTLALAALGTGIGLSAVSPWEHQSVGLTTFAVSSAVWLVVMQWLSSAMGGYLAGRLRVRSPSTTRHEAYFRDTAHGFLAWAVSTLLVAILLGSSIGSVISGGASAISTAVGGAASGATQSAANHASNSNASGLPTGYYVDMLFRPGQTASAPAAAPGTPGAETYAEDQSEATQIVLRDVAAGDWSAPDKAQLAHLIAVHTGMSDGDAQHRVDDVINQINAAKVKLQQTADSARKATLTFSIMTALSMAIGAFIAAASGALGGRLRDEY